MNKSAGICGWKHYNLISMKLSLNTESSYYIKSMLSFKHCFCTVNIITEKRRIRIGTKYYQIVHKRELKLVKIKWIFYGVCILHVSYTT